MTPPLIGVDSYAYHRWFGEVSRWEVPRRERWSPLDFLDRAHQLEVTGVSLQTVHLGSISLKRVAEEAGDRQLDLVMAWGHRSGLDGGTSPSRLRDAERWIDEVAAVGCRLLRIVCGDHTWWDSPLHARVERLVPMLSALAARAGKVGLDLAIENHADMRMEDIVTLISKVAAPNLGICFDLGNAVRVGDDLLAAARQAAPLARMVHVKDIRVQEASLGNPSAWWPTTPLGKGDLPVAHALRATVAASWPPRWYVEMATMHPDHPDEDAAVSESVSYLRSLAESA